MLTRRESNHKFQRPFASSKSKKIRTAPQPERFDARDLRPKHIRAAPQRERFDTHDLRRGFAETKTNSYGATARALRHARSLQKVRRDQDTFARHHSESASTRTISAEGSPNSHGATVRALRPARSPQTGTFRKLTLGLPPPEKEEELRVEKRRYKRKVSLCFLDSEVTPEKLACAFRITR